VIDAGTDSKAEWFIDQLRTCFGEFNCTPLAFNHEPAELLKRIFLGDSPLGFTLGRECRMQDLSDSKSIATWREFELTDPAIRKHVNEHGDITKFKFVEGDAADIPDSDDPLARLDADFVLLSGAVTRMIANLKKLLGGYATAD
jgi:recombination associated protein RdgC